MKRARHQIVNVPIDDLATELHTFSVEANKDQKFAVPGPLLNQATIREILEAYLVARARIVATGKLAPPIESLGFLGLRGIVPLMKATTLLIARRTFQSLESSAAIRDAVDTLCAHPDDTDLLCGEIFARMRWPGAAERSPELRRLNAHAFEACTIAGQIARAEYLRYQMGDDLTLSRPERDLAHTLTSDWQGTFDDLLATARNLCRV
jgi:hypothetical protein